MLQGAVDEPDLAQPAGMSTTRSPGPSFVPQGEAKERFNEIQQELSQLSTKFSNNVLDATKVRRAPPWGQLPCCCCLPSWLMCHVLAAWAGAHVANEPASLRRLGQSDRLMAGACLRPNHHRPTRSC